MHGPLITKAVTEALAEDLGLAGDITTNATIPVGATARANICARKPGIVSGVAVAEAAFRALDPETEFIVRNPDGS